MNGRSIGVNRFNRSLSCGRCDQSEPNDDMLVFTPRMLASRSWNEFGSIHSNKGTLTCSRRWPLVAEPAGSLAPIAGTT